MIHEIAWLSMYDTERNKHHKHEQLVSVIICSIVRNLINTSTLTEKKQVFQCTNSKMLFVKRNVHLLKI